MLVRLSGMSCKMNKPWKRMAGGLSATSSRLRRCSFLILLHGLAILLATSLPPATANLGAAHTGAAPGVRQPSGFSPSRLIEHKNLDELEVVLDVQIWTHSHLDGEAPYKIDPALPHGREIRVSLRRLLSTFVTQRQMQRRRLIANVLLTFYAGFLPH